MTKELSRGPPSINSLNPAILRSCLDFVGPLVDILGGGFGWPARAGHCLYFLRLHVFGILSLSSQIVDIGNAVEMPHS
jgi:hypothetical protein